MILCKKLVVCQIKQASKTDKTMYTLHAELRVLHSKKKPHRNLLVDSVFQSLDFNRKKPVHFKIEKGSGKE